MELSESGQLSGSDQGAAPEVSFIIPTFNEEAVIGTTISSIHRVVRPFLTYEITVVDSGSSDRTVHVAQANGARTICVERATIGAARNRAAAAVLGSIIVFLDADVLLTDAWGVEFRATVQELRKDELLLTGSWCAVPDDASWLERHWFAPLVHRQSSHIGSGHMVLSSALFRKARGFDESLETGEDYDLSVRAAKLGARIVENPALRAVHLGYPRTIRAFVRREAWHGRSDFASLDTVVGSSVAVATTLFAASHVLALAGLAVGSVPAFFLCVLLVIGLCCAASVKRYGVANPVRCLTNSVLYYFYFLGRTFALVSRITGQDTFVPRDRR